MVIVSSFKIVHNHLDDIFTIISENESIHCPLCDGELTYRDTKLRKVKNLLGEIRRFLLRRLRCTECKKLHTELPDIIQPYKQYDSETIQKVLDGCAEATVCAADDSTIRRWKNEFSEAEPDINQRLASVYAQMSDGGVPITATFNVLGRVKIEIKRWLSFVMELLINNGHKICTQFAFCPSSIPDTVSPASKNATEGSRIDDKTIKDTS